MIKKLLVSTGLFMLCHSFLNAQDKDNSFSRWYFKPAIGVNFPLTNLSTNHVTDDLINYNNQTNLYGQALSINYFFNANWGVEMMGQAFITTNYEERNERFNDNLVILFSHDYYLDITPFPAAQSSMLNVLVGIVYRYERKQFVFQPRLLAGITAIDVNLRTAQLKQKGTNNISQLQYTTADMEIASNKETENFTAALGFTVGYRISKRFLLQAEGMYSYYKFDQTIFESTTDLFTNQTTSTPFVYNKDMHNLSIGIGLIIEIKSLFKKR